MHTWPGVDVPARRRRLRDLLEVGVREHRDRAVRAELERDFLTPATSAIRRPTRAEPVNEILRTRSSAQSASPRSPPGPVIVWSASGGRPASSSSSVSFSAVSGVCDAGLSTTALPAASAGATLCATSRSG